MSSKERLVQLAEAVPEDMATFAFSLLKSFLDTADELADDAFCKHLLQQALADPTPGFVDFDEACKLSAVAKVSPLGEMPEGQRGS